MVTPNKNISILIVDDEVEIVKVVRLSAESVGFEARVETDASKALAHIQTNEPDVLLTDLRMPKLDGMTLIQESTALHPQLKVIVITGNGSKEDVMAALRLGVYDFIEKPLSMTRLETVLRNALTLKKTEKERDELMNRILRLTE